jgi:pimeloyl-ACP methyl ester carboxylesterase
MKSNAKTARHLLPSSMIGANAQAHDTARLSTPAGCHLLAMLVLGSFAVPACGDQAHSHGGTLISVDPIGDLDLDVEQIGQYLSEFGLDPAAAQYAVKTFEYVYRTVDATGEPTIASGLFALPATGDDRELPLVTWLHGTRVYRGEVASMDAGSDDRRFVMAFASAGYAVTAPDYLGLGRSPVPHPWMDPGAAVTGSMDALRATQEIAAREDRRLTHDVLVTGFSHGGNSAMALARAIQQDENADLALGALAPIGGGYGWSQWIKSALAEDSEIIPKAATIYLGYLTVAWNRLHHYYGAPSEVFRAPYDEMAETLFDNDHTIEQIFPAMPVYPSDLLTAEFAARLRQPTGALAAALAAADAVCDWTPGVPVHLYTASGDHEMPSASTEHCRHALEARGAEVEVIDVGDFDHFGSAMESVPKILELFDGLPR